MRRAMRPATKETAMKKPQADRGEQGQALVLLVLALFGLAGFAALALGQSPPPQIG